MSTLLNPEPASRPDKRSGEGYAYGRPAATYNPRLKHVGPGTPCGEWMRRYWLPVLTSAHVSSTPQTVRILGEDLVVFRDKTGRVGLLYPRCMHRGTSLLYGRVDERGIRCCYHGWLFDTTGNCLDQPCEPKGGLAREAARQPWYPVEERYGMVWTYMGPPEKKPLLPRYDIFESLAPGEFIDADDGEVLGLTGDSGMPVVNYNWLQASENGMDPFHIQVLHSTFSEVQFVAEFEKMPTVNWDYVDNGISCTTNRRLADGRELERISLWLPPCISSVPDLKLERRETDLLAWFVPVDDTHVRSLAILRTTVPFRSYFKISGKTWNQKTPAERRDFPNDFEAQSGQGVISLDSEEHLATSDRGVVMVRRLIEQQIRAVEKGKDPMGVAHAEDHALVKIPDGNHFKRQGGSRQS